MKNYILALTILIIASGILLWHKSYNQIDMEIFSSLANNNECTISSVNTEGDFKKITLKDNASDDFVDYLLNILELHSEKTRYVRFEAFFDYEVSFNKNDQIKFLFHRDDKAYLDFYLKSGNKGTIFIDSEGANLLESYLEACFSNNVNETINK